MANVNGINVEALLNWIAKISAVFGAAGILLILCGGAYMVEPKAGGLIVCAYGAFLIVAGIGIDKASIPISDSANAGNPKP